MVETVHSLVSAKTVAPVTRLVGSAAAHLESVETCARTVSDCEITAHNETISMPNLLFQSLSACLDEICLLIYVSNYIHMILEHL